MCVRVSTLSYRLVLVRALMGMSVNTTVIQVCVGLSLSFPSQHTAPTVQSFMTFKDWLIKAAAGLGLNLVVSYKLHEDETVFFLLCVQYQGCGVSFCLLQSLREGIWLGLGEAKHNLDQRFSILYRLCNFLGFSISFTHLMGVSLINKVLGVK